MAIFHRFLRAHQGLAFSLSFIRYGLVAGLLACGITTAWAEPTFKSDHPDQYVVRKGDTLWGISDKFLNTPWKWPEIWHANSQIQNPHLIYPGDVIRLIYVDGKPMLTVLRAGQGPYETRLADGTIKLSPRARVSKLDSVIPAIPLDAVQSFLVDHRIVGKEDLDNAPYVLSGHDSHLLIGNNDKFYVRGLTEKSQAAFGVYRKGEPFYDPDTGEFLGLEAEQLGVSKLLQVEGEIGTLRMLRSKRDVRIGDRLLPTEDRQLDSVFYPKSPKTDIEGKIIHVFGGVRNVSQYNVVVLNRGEREFLAVGDVLAVDKVGDKIRDQLTKELIQLPSERAGLLIVFRTFEKVAFGLVLKADRPMSVMDTVRNP